MFQLLTHEKGQLTQRFFEEVAVQVRKNFEHANRDAESWLKAIMAPMEIQIREHQIQLKRRLESIKRIHQATDTLEERIDELQRRGQVDRKCSTQQSRAEHSPCPAADRASTECSAFKEADQGTQAALGSAAQSDGSG
jgi:3-dehydroquinate dehydratase